MGSKNSKANAFGGDIGNTATLEIAEGEPYSMDIEVEGVSPMLFHRWNVEAVEEKSKAAKGSKIKKEDNVESYVYRDARGILCVPGEYLRQGLIHAAKYKQDPRSPRKSLMDMAKAALIIETELSPLSMDGKPLKTYYEDKRRVTVQRAGITRTRPGINTGWRAKFRVLVILPEYFRPELINELAVNAGRLCGFGDFRPTYGRFRVASCDVAKLA